MMISAMATCSFGQPLTAPAVSPATIRRWNTSTMITTGIVTTTDAAMIAVIGDWNCDAPVKNVSAAGTVRARSVDVSERPAGTRSSRRRT